MSKKKRSFFRISAKEEVKHVKDDKKEFITWGAAWLYARDGYDMPYFSVSMTKEDLQKVIDYAETTEDGNVNYMMFANDNRREGHRDPDYYLVPPLNKE